LRAHAHRRRGRADHDGRGTLRRLKAMASEVAAHRHHREARAARVLVALGSYARGADDDNIRQFSNHAENAPIWPAAERLARAVNARSRSRDARDEVDAQPVGAWRPVGVKQQRPVVSVDPFGG